VPRPWPRPRRRRWAQITAAIYGPGPSPAEARRPRRGVDAHDWYAARPASSSSIENAGARPELHTATLRTGTPVSGEISHHFDFVQILAGDVLSAALSPIEFTPTFGEGPLGDYGPNETVSGVEKLDKTQLELGLRQLLGPRLGASQSVLGVDFGWVHVHHMPGKDELPLSAPGVGGEADFDHLPTSSSWGYRVAGALTYEGVLGRFTLQPHAAWLHDVRGISPGPGGPFLENRKAINVGVALDYINTWFVQLDYTTLFGAGRFNLQNDRDFVRLQVSYFY
jgi:hypothetical protein